MSSGAMQYMSSWVDVFLIVTVAVMALCFIGAIVWLFRK